MPRNAAVLPSLARCACPLVDDERSERGLASRDAVVREIDEDVPHLVSEGNAIHAQSLAEFSVCDD